MLNNLKEALQEHIRAVSPITELLLDVESNVDRENREAKEEIVNLLGSTQKSFFVEIEKDYKQIRRDILDYIPYATPHELYYTLKNDLSSVELAENRLESDVVINDKKYSKGMRVTRFIRRAWTDLVGGKNASTLEEYIVTYSKALNDKIIDGELFITVEPSHFLGMSNGRNWSSCFRPGGEYSTGTLSYALDRSTVLAALVSKGDSEAYAKGENVKLKWRQVFHLSDDLTSALVPKAYPYDNHQLTKAAAQAIFGTEDLLEVSEPLLNNVRTYGKGYYDIVAMSRERAWLFSTESSAESANHKDYHIGSTVDCISCGDDMATSTGLLCPECSGYAYCDDCGEGVPEDEIITTYDGDVICEGCAEWGYVWCDDVDDYVREGEAVYSEQCGYFIHVSSIDNGEYMECEYCGEVFPSDEKCFSCEKEEIEVNYVLLADKKGRIGKDNELLYEFKEDMEHFKEVVRDSVVVMGRKTFESIPEKGLVNIAKRNKEILVYTSDFRKNNDDIEIDGVVIGRYCTFGIFSGQFYGGDKEVGGKISIVGGAQLYSRRSRRSLLSDTQYTNKSLNINFFLTTPKKTLELDSEEGVTFVDMNEIDAVLNSNRKVTVKYEDENILIRHVQGVSSFV